MIKKLIIKNWKCYETLELRFEKGVNFIVGYNGIGKTSILEALIFGLLGRVRTKDLEGFKKIGSKENTKVKLKFEFQNEIFEIIRNFNGKYESQLILPQSKRRFQAKDEILKYVENLFDSNQVFLENMIFSSEGEVYEFLQLNSKKLVNYLEKIIGIGKTSEFKKSISELNRYFIKEKKENEDYIKILNNIKIKRENVNLSQLKDEQKELKLELNKLKEQQKIKEDELVKYDNKLVLLNSNYREFEFLSKKAENFYNTNKEIFIDTNISRFNIQELISGKNNLDLIMKNYTEELQKIDADIKSTEKKLYEKELRIKDKDKIKAIIENLEVNFIETTKLPCPICQKNLSKNEFLQINKDIFAQIETLNNEFAEIKGELKFLKDLEKELGEKMNSFRKFYDLIKSIKELGPQKTKQYGTNKQEYERKVGELIKQFRILEEKEFEYEDKLKEIDYLINKLKMAQEIKDKFKYEQNYKENVKGKLLTEITLKAIDEIIGKQRNINLKDLIEEIENIWKAFFPFEQRELYFDKKYLPYFKKGEEIIPFDNISGGEKMILLILIKTVLLKMYTKIPFLILDEPLEHLNLENRINIVDYLADIYNKGLIEQLIITTFEESLTRKFRDMKDVNIISLPSILKYKFS